MTSKRELNRFVNNMLYKNQILTTTSYRHTLTCILHCRFLFACIYIYNMHNSVQVQATLRRAARECIPGETKDDKKQEKKQKTGKGKGKGKRGKGRGGRRGRGGRGRGRKQDPAEMVEAADSDLDENPEMKILAKEDQQIYRELANEDLEMDEEVVGLNSATNSHVPVNGL